MNNPVTSLWLVQFQFDNFKLANFGDSPVGGKWVNSLVFQPVLPIALTDELSLITRPIFTVYQSVPHPTAAGVKRTTEFGDTVLAQLISPNHTDPWIVAAGWTWVFPTAGSDFTGQGKWQVGPAVGGGYISNRMMIAGLVQQWWSVAGESERKRTSQMSILPLVYGFFGDGWSIGYSGNIQADFKAPHKDVWTVPVGLSLGKVVMFGKLPVQIRGAGQYIPIRPDGGPEWNVQLQITPIIPKLIKGAIFK